MECSRRRLASEAQAIMPMVPPADSFAEEHGLLALSIAQKENSTRTEGQPTRPAHHPRTWPLGNCCTGEPALETFKDARLLLFKIG
eukprot:16401195-Heterocapsa_arctica.AAC.1